MILLQTIFLVLATELVVPNTSASPSGDHSLSQSPLPATTSATNAVSVDKRRSVGTAKIKSDSTYYDRKEGFAYFSGRVYVEDKEYQLHTDRAYVFMNASNDLQRIVALGHVAITNGTKRAYGAKASYYRAPGLVVLSGNDEIVAEVSDESKSGRQMIRGKKIKFWTGSEQMEVVEAEISAPSQGGLNGGVKNLMGGR